MQNGAQLRRIGVYARKYRERKKGAVVELKDLAPKDGIFIQVHYWCLLGPWMVCYVLREGGLTWVGSRITSRNSPLVSRSPEID